MKKLLLVSITLLALMGACRDAVGFEKKIEVEIGHDDIHAGHSDIKKEVEVQITKELTKETQPIKILEEVLRNIRAELVENEVPDEGIEQIIKEILTDLEEDLKEYKDKSKVK